MNFQTEAQLRQELEEVWMMLRTAQAAERTLQSLGYTYHGGELWKPPLGTPATLCPCKDRPASACPGEWEQGCDLGANAAHVRVHQPAASAKEAP